MRNKNYLQIKDISVHLVENSKITRHDLKKRLLRDGLLENKCYKCGLGTIWNGEKLSLQLEHINGISNDNRIENLEILCPNCHTQTKTYGSKRFKIINKCKECGRDIYKYSERCVKCKSLPFKKVLK